MPRDGKALGSGTQFAGDRGECLAEAADVGFEVPGGDAGLCSFTHSLGLFGAGEYASE